MRILVTGAAGFIGQIVSKALLADDGNLLVLTDVQNLQVPDNAIYPQNATIIQGDLFETAEKIVDERLDAAVLLHGIMSSGAEANFELGYRVNVDSTRVVLAALARKCPGVRVLYASSEAVYGRPVPKHGVVEADIATPEMSYGCQKLICETFINDYTRRGLLNGFSLRFPTISVRAGRPTAAVTSFLSGIIREPMNGEKCRLPLNDRSWKHWLCSPKTLVNNISIALKLPVDALPPHRRAINMPGIAVTLQDMFDALEKVGGKEKLSLVHEEPDPDLRPVLNSWADDFDNSLAFSLGMKSDTSFEQIVWDYVSDLKRER